MQRDLGNPERAARDLGVIQQGKPPSPAWWRMSPWLCLINQGATDRKTLSSALESSMSWSCALAAEEAPGILSCVRAGGRRRYPPLLSAWWATRSVIRLLGTSMFS